MGVLAVSPRPGRHRHLQLQHPRHVGLPQLPEHRPGDEGPEPAPRHPVSPLQGRQEGGGHPGQRSVFSETEGKLISSRKKKQLNLQKCPKRDRITTPISGLKFFRGKYNEPFPHKTHHIPLRQAMMLLLHIACPYDDVFMVVLCYDILIVV